ncbi:MAG: peptidoglycan editing factor PgeF [Xanthomonadales bacterium]|nr:peptidoglycan editing factor PgeF [Xanthomonadales bacterium]
MTEQVIHPSWPAPANVHALVTTRDLDGESVVPWERCNLGLHSGDALLAVEHNRSRLQAVLGLPSAPHWLHQVHGTRVIVATPQTGSAEPQADAAVTQESAVVLAILSADCLPVLLCSRDGREFAAAHAGWRGLAAGVLEATLASMRTPAVQCLAWLGPCIGAHTYEVGNEVRQAFVDGGPANAEQAFTATRAGHWYADLAMLARQRLLHAGVGGVYGGGFDTLTDARFYSYRRDGARSGRFASLIWRSAG